MQPQPLGLFILSQPILVVSTFPDRESAQKFAQLLVEDKLAACVNILSACESYYRWQGKVENATEYPVLIKSLQSNFDRIEAVLRQHHPYELPEIIVVPIAGGMSEYLEWLINGCSQE
jgi:periplasmic divalent cation tolerance protein